MAYSNIEFTSKLQMTGKAASQYLYLWKGKGLVQSLGGQLGVWANMLTTRHPNWDEALLMAMPTAVLVGIEALRRASWTTQIPQRPQVAVNVRKRRTQTDLYEIDFRGARWFNASKAGIVRTQNGHLPCLSPAWALADLLRQEEWGDFGLQRDDIEWEQVTEEDESQWTAACQAYDIDQPSLTLSSLAMNAR